MFICFDVSVSFVTGLPSVMEQMYSCKGLVYTYIGFSHSTAFGIFMWRVFRHSHVVGICCNLISS